MVSDVAWTLGSVAVVSLISAIGAVALSFGALRRHGVVMFLVALAAGTLLGDAFLHILPEAAAEDGLDKALATWVLAGFLVMFVLEVGLRWRHGHLAHAEHHPHHDAPRVEPFGWLNLFGDALHNLIDGVVIAAAYLVDVGLGIATTIAVVLHEIPQELGDFAVLIRSGLSERRALLLNLMSAAVAFAGAGLILAIGLDAETLEQVALPLVAGGFIYIAASDLIPELHHHSKGRDAAIILFGLLLGFAAMYGLLEWEAVGGGGDDHGHS